VEYLSSDNVGKDINQSRVVQTSEAIMEPNFWLIISIVCSVIAVGLLAVLIFMHPERDYSNPNPNANTMYDNFFYNVEYSYYYSGNFRRPIFKPTAGFYIFMPIIMITAVISGTGVLVKDPKHTRYLIFTNWVLYTIPIAMSIAIEIWKNLRYWDNSIQALGFYPFYLNIFLQFALLLDRNSFLDWAGFSKESEKQNDRASLIYRRVNAIIFLTIYLYTFGIPFMGIFTQINNILSMFAHMWIAVSALILWLICGEVIRKVVTANRRRSKVLDYIVRHYIGTSEMFIPTIAEQVDISIKEARMVIYKSIRAGRILGEISVDGNVLVLHDPETYFKKPEKPIEELKEIEPRVAKIIEAQPYLFWISVAFSIIAVGTLTVLICFTPLIEDKVSGLISTTGNNFFYRWYYYTYDTTSYLRYVKPHIGFYILMPISVLTLTVSGLGVLVRNRDDSKKLVYINWILYLIPIIAGIVMSTIGLLTLKATNQPHIDVIGTPILLSLFYLTPFVFVQGSMYVFSNNFGEWSNFKGGKSFKEKPIKAGRLTSAIFFFLIFAWMWFYPIGLMIPTFYNDTMHITHLSLYIGLMVWWVLGDLVGLISLKAKWKSTIKRTFEMGIYDLETISMRYDIPLEITKEVAHILIVKGTISGELDEKNNTIIPKIREGETICNICKKVNELDAKFCSHCGAKIAHTIQPKEEKTEKSTKTSIDTDKLPFTKNKIIGMFSLAIFFIATISYSVLMYFGFDYFFATIPFAVLIIAGTILGAKSSYYSIGKAGYSLNLVSFFVIIIYIFTMLMWAL